MFKSLFIKSILLIFDVKKLGGLKLVVCDDYVDDESLIEI